ncbi:MAG: glutaredoxin family protein [Gemmatimonadales bacterium]
MKALLPQTCPLALLYATWVVYVAGFAYLVLELDLLMAVVWLVALPAAWWGYVTLFPAVSRYLGYGRVDDVAPTAVEESPVKVTMYSSLGCPFCPIVEARLEALRRDMGFEFEHTDVTLRPGLLVAKGIRSVPVVEVGERRHVGHATTRELAELIGGAVGGAGGER